ncbi:hypothetical protein [Shewanella dokdonensis]|uniref:Uncharacterized protein n=1 Tax=Shewanella dokdonensis TaxID=712036 RepID=A0ABX8DE60_9GAMM|nr:hypothetical protein [Shewanella dokdonensis]MCL1073093.1 hypothetical protein [Shewanella dokdonensis]QVK23019.1 hypothetical protein KHX94_18150 [Shewanella dokdonensis]
MSKTIVTALIVIGLVILGLFGWQHQRAKQLPLSGSWSSGCIVDGDKSKEFIMEFGKDTYRSNASLYDNTQCQAPTISEYHGSAYAEVADAHLQTCDGSEAIMFTLYWDDKTQPKPLVIQHMANNQLLTGFPQPQTADGKGRGWCIDKSTVYSPLK